MGDVKYWDGKDFTVLDSKNAKSVNGIKFRINEDILEYSNDGLTWEVTTPDTTYDVATTTTNGLMSSADKVKLNGIETGAQKNNVTSTDIANWNNKVDKVSGKQLSTNDYTTVEKNKLAGIEAGAEKNNVTSSDISNWNNKVDKVNGKQLSTNDYTTVEKNKLSGIQAGAQVNAVTSVNGQTGAVTTPDTTYDIATTSANGLMSSADKTKLNGIEAGSQKNTISSVQGRTGAVTISKSDVGLGSVNNVAITSSQVTKLANDQENVFLTQTAYDALTNAQKYDPLKLYFITGGI